MSESKPKQPRMRDIGGQSVPVVETYLDKVTGAFIDVVEQEQLTKDRHGKSQTTKIRLLLKCDEETVAAIKAKRPELGSTARETLEV